MITVTKSFDFCYAHHLPGYIGKCCQLHGHNGKLEVTFGMSDRDFREVQMQHTPNEPYISRLPSEYMADMHCKPGDFHAQLYIGMVMDFNDMKSMVAPILEQLDHQELNGHEFFPSHMMPTAENMAMQIKDILEDDLADTPVFVQRVRVYETPTSYAEWVREEA
jgi:6-pyruvoyltetrahydropterin/6-carboxytetrahydropterin synthase